MLESRRVDAQPRGPHGLLLRDTTDPAMNPFSVESRGRFVAEPVIDFAQDAIDRAKAARRKKVADGDDWALIWRVTPEMYESAPEHPDRETDDRDDDADHGDRETGTADSR